MDPQENFNKAVRKLQSLMATVFFLFMLVCGFLTYLLFDPTLSAFQTKSPPADYVVVEEPEDDFDKIENGIHLRTGFVEGEGLMAVVNNCTNCHSAKLVTQNRMSKERWLATIRWMQETQNLWDLGKNEEIIVNYLATHYAPTKKGRRQNLENIEWYVLED